MNKNRRERIKERIAEIEDVMQNITDAADNLSTISTEVSDIKDEEYDAFNNLSDSLQDSDKGQKMKDSVDILDLVESGLDSISTKLGSIFGDVKNITSKLGQAMK